MPSPSSPTYSESPQTPPSDGANLAARDWSQYTAARHQNDQTPTE